MRAHPATVGEMMVLILMEGCRYFPHWLELESLLLCPGFWRAQDTAVKTLASWVIPVQVANLVVVDNSDLFLD